MDADTNRLLALREHFVKVGDRALVDEIDGDLARHGIAPRATAVSVDGPSPPERAVKARPARRS